MQIAEQSFSKNAAKSGHEACKAALSLTGAVVVKTGQGQIVERHSDGTSIVINQMPVSKRVKSGVTLRRVKSAD